MRRHLIAACFLALAAALVVAGSAGATTPLRAGPYALLVTIEPDLARAGQPLAIRICPVPGGPALDGATVTIVAIPAAGTAGVAGAPHALRADRDAPGCLAGRIVIGAIGAWTLGVLVDGVAGPGDAAMTLSVAESASIPVWVGWAIGLSPLVGFGWLTAWQARHWRRLAHPGASGELA